MKNRAYKYRFYPTDEQVTLLAQTFGCVRKAYNTILRWRTDAYYQAQEKIGYIQASAKLTEIKKLSEFSYLNDVSCVPLQQCLRHQQTAFKNFFEGRAKYLFSKRKTANNRLNSPKVLLNTQTVKSILPKAKSRSIFAGRVICLANQALSIFPKTVQGVTLFRACASLKIKSCQKPTKPLVLT
jgi:putative transposase